MTLVLCRVYGRMTDFSSKNTFSQKKTAGGHATIICPKICPFFSLKENRWLKYNFRFRCNLDNSFKSYGTQLFVLFIQAFCHKFSCHSFILAMGTGLSGITLLKVKLAMIRKRVVWRTLSLHYSATPCPSIWTYNRFFLCPALGENTDQQMGRGT